MSTGVLRLDLAFRRRSTLAYSLGMAVYMLIVVALYPAFKDSSNLDELTQNASGVAALFGISGSITSPTGWIAANAYSNFFPLLILMMTIGYGAGAIAGQEHDGHLELVLSLPFPRRTVITQKMVALVVQASIFTAVVFACVLVGHWFDLTVAFGHVATATVGVLLLGIDLGLLALAVGAASGNRGLALGIAALVAAASYLVSSLAPLIHWLQPVRYASLFYWSVGDNQLDQGLSGGAWVVLVATGLVLAIASVLLFDRHDVAT